MRELNFAEVNEVAGGFSFSFDLGGGFSLVFDESGLRITYEM